MNDRERLVSPLMELVAEGLDISEKENGKFNTFKFADHLISHGVTIERHGRWEEKPFLLGTTNVCSECGEYYGMPHGKYNYCPNCGAKNGESDDT